MKPKNLITSKRKRSSGQALVEYVLMFAVMAGLTGLIGRFMPGVLAKLEKPLKHDFRMIYKYGAKDVCGFDADDGDPCSGSPVKHPRYVNAGNFKLFGRK